MRESRVEEKREEEKERKKERGKKKGTNKKNNLKCLILCGGNATICKNILAIIGHVMAEHFFIFFKHMYKIYNIKYI